MFDRNKMVSHLMLISALLATVTSDFISREVILEAAVFPSAIDAIVGEEIFIKITKPAAKQNQCYYQRVGGAKISLKTQS